ncbi:hypothetical protein C0Q70_00111 [Pomacea canaliculata]|uniref:Uncharacterized protein n=1 Tax=Pomacea canaliculata TaxID=400727 RepID=A0A2T7PVV9_POMCA|nr:hypothetical protein C0Q70_00111 [Pomacea canaliculata]
MARSDIVRRDLYMNNVDINTQGKAMASDRRAVQRMPSIAASTASYKLRHGLQKTLQDEILAELKTCNSHAMASDRRAVQRMPSIAASTASYKLRHGLQKTLQDEILAELKTCYFSLNIDEAMSKTKKKVLAIFDQPFLAVHEQDCGASFRCHQGVNEKGRDSIRKAQIYLRKKWSTFTVAGKDRKFEAGEQDFHLGRTDSHLVELTNIHMESMFTISSAANTLMKKQPKEVKKSYQTQNERSVCEVWHLPSRENACKQQSAEDLLCTRSYHEEHKRRQDNCWARFLQGQLVQNDQDQWIDFTGR